MLLDTDEGNAAATDFDLLAEVARLRQVIERDYRVEGEQQRWRSGIARMRHGADR